MNNLLVLPRAEQPLETFLRKHPPETIPNVPPKTIEISKRSSNPEEDTALIQDLDSACSIGLEGWRDYITQRSTGRAKIDQIAMINRDRFLEFTVPKCAFEIVKIMDGLVRYDDYIEEIFGEYKQFYQKIKEEKNVDDRADLFRELIICAKSVISKSVPYIKPKVVIPTIGRAFQSDNGSVATE